MFFEGPLGSRFRSRTDLFQWPTSDSLFQRSFDLLRRISVLMVEVVQCPIYGGAEPTFEAAYPFLVENL